mmetsp:Transcript_46011/g.75063  ORF Transcript_46011/g.75063 Transcript_46011/m.75063 type:complete len:526 (+) Transcript_46011:174-1751(+)|eukprot:CAMPEP_0184659484 /NCGR_PEP_ID=MMETSP0308-20130426/29772_1 /TAXON_ID=38269 /ORGANISM="Gloeochaete witrockiana, Strain SAG 46.84" /LENGTH=525 /DNA_ID=CAMNT_0027099337 /DNA_START=60 /DNA_END=1637 /DNA_ORIENTATION=+
MASLGFVTIGVSRSVSVQTALPLFSSSNTCERGEVSKPKSRSSGFEADLNRNFFGAALRAAALPAVANDSSSLQVKCSGESANHQRESPVQILLRMSSLNNTSLTLLDQWQLTQLDNTLSSMDNSHLPEHFRGSVVENLTVTYLAKKGTAIINAALTACFGAKKADQAVQLLTDMPKNGHVPDATCFKIVIDGLGKEGRLKDALDIFGTMYSLNVAPTTGVYRVVIRACLRNENLPLAVQGFEAMKSEGLRPDEYTYRLLGAAYCRVGEISKAFQLLEEMVASNIRPDTYNLETLMDACLKARNLPGVLRILQVLPSYTLRGAANIVKAFSMSGDLKGCLSMLQRVSKYADFSAKMAAYNALLDASIFKSDLEMTIQVLSEMGSKGIPPHEGSFGSMVEVFVQSGDYTHIKRLWQEIRFTDCSLNEDAFYSLANRAIRAHDAETVSDVLDYANWSNQALSNEWYGHVLQLSAAEGQHAIYGSVMGAVQRKGVTFDITTTNNLEWTFLENGMFPRSTTPVPDDLAA